MSKRRIGVYICHCGGNISDYVDVERVKESLQGEEDVAVLKTAMFTCSDATQQEMVQDIQLHNLDGLVVASCSPKLHLHTFREVAKRAGLNPYQYTQVNIREQCSWTHTDDWEGATDKAVRLIRGGIARTRLSEPLEPIILETVPQVLVIGAGIGGLRAALGLSDLGLAVCVVEKSAVVGGWVGECEKMYPSGKNGKELITGLLAEIKKRDNMQIFTSAELVEKTGSIGNFNVTIRVNQPVREGEPQLTEEIKLQVGAIIVATGFEAYQPQGEYGHGLSGVITYPEFKRLLDKSDNRLLFNGKEISSVVYIYCVGSRQAADVEYGNAYCSRYCCNAAVHTAILAAEKNPKINQFHLYRDMRTYGRYELLYSRARETGSRFLNFDAAAPPLVQRGGDGKLLVTVRDLLTYGEEVEIEADIVVLMTGMVPRQNKELTAVLKLPVGSDGFYNEIHPKLRPVETMVGGVFICGSCQGPKNSAESVASALAAVTQSASLLKKGSVELEPLIAVVKPELCNGCGECLETCPYSALEEQTSEGKNVAFVNRALCTGCGGCVPLCKQQAIELKGYTDAQIKSTIAAFLKEAGQE